MIWTVAEARARFAEFLRAAQSEPQRIERYGELVGIFVGAELGEEYLRFQRSQSGQSVGAAFEEFRSLDQTPTSPTREEGAM